MLSTWVSMWIMESQAKDCSLNILSFILSWKLMYDKILIIKIYYTWLIDFLLYNLLVIDNIQILIINHCHLWVYSDDYDKNNILTLLV